MPIAECEKYIDLLNEFPPRPIRSEDDFKAVQKVIDTLLDADQISADRREYLNLLGLLVHEYEEKTVEIPDVHGVELLNILIAEWGLKQKELVPIFKTESIVSAVVNGHRLLTVEHLESFFMCHQQPFSPHNYL
jgi:HTH-type transcriptional regulator / antitoxin HigA